MNIILSDYESVWYDIWPRNQCRSLWPTFHCPVILPYILNSIWWMNAILLKSRQRWNAEVDLSIIGSPGRTSAEDERDLRSPGRAEVWKAEFQIFGSKDRTELRKQSFRPLKVLAERKWGSWTSYRWQLRQSRSAEAEIHIFDSPGRDEMRKWTYPYLDVPVEQLRKMTGRKCGSGTSHLMKNWQSRSTERISCHIIGSQAKWKCGIWNSVLTL